MRTFNEDLQILGIKEKEYTSIISYIYDKTPGQMFVLAKSIKSGANVLLSVKMAFERVLNMRSTERKEVFDYYFN